MARNRNKYRDDYTSECHPKSKGQGKVYHQPRRNYWGNLFDEDTVEGRERLFMDESGTDSLFDPEDSADSFYDNDNYE